MPRQPKRGIEYAGWNVDIFENDTKIDALLDAQGWNGFAIYFYLCQRAYASDGYYYKWSYDNAPTTARRMGGGIRSETVRCTVAACLQIGLFDKRLFDVEGVLTSKGIQRRYAQAIQNRRCKTVDKTFWLLDEKETEELGIASANADLLGANSDLLGANSDLHGANVPKSKVKESKVKDSKEKESKEKRTTSAKLPKVDACGMIEAAHFSPALEDAVKEWVQYKNEKRQSYKETGLRRMLGSIRIKAGELGEKAVIDALNDAMANNWQGFHFDTYAKNARSSRKANRLKEVDTWTLE